MCVLPLPIGSESEPVSKVWIDLPTSAVVRVWRGNVGACLFFVVIRQGLYRIDIEEVLGLTFLLLQGRYWNRGHSIELLKIDSLAVHRHEKGRVSFPVLFCPALL